MNPTILVINLDELNNWTMPKHLLLSTRKGLATYSKSNGDLKYTGTHFAGIPICLTHHDRSRDILWAFQDHGHWGIKMQRSKDFGKSWEEVEAMAYPEGSTIKDDIAASLKYIWAVETDSKGRMWVGTVPGGLFMSEDGGNSWELNQALWNHPHRPEHWFGGGMDHAGIHSIVIDPNDDDHIYVGISVAGVYETTDGGQNWELRNKGLRADFMPDPYAELSHDPHLLVACPASPKHMWQQNHCGIFKTADGGMNWQDVGEAEGPAKFGFAIEVHDTNPDVAWVVPGVSDERRVAIDEALVVCRTDDGGKTWQQLRTGLPQSGVFDIVYRHALARDGDALVFGTTTGNAYISNDAGDSWTTLSNNLPLINAVTFAET